MKIFKWRIYPSSRIERVVTMLDGIQDDRNMAKELLIPSTSEGKWPKYKIVVRAETVSLIKQLNENGTWMSERYESYGDKFTRRRIISQYKTIIKKSKFKEYTLNF